MKSNKITAGILISISASALLASVYIVPANISKYESQTDQTFYDMYQNPNSVIANGANKEMQKLTSNISTGARYASGATLNRAAQTFVAGVPVKGGTHGHFVLEGHTYTVNVAKNGTPSLTGYLSNGKGQIVMKGSNVVDASGAHTTSSGKWGKTQQRSAEQIYFDLSTGTLTTTAITQQKDYRNNGKYGMRATDNWHEVGINNITRKQIGLAKMLNGSNITSKRIVTPGPNFINNPSYNQNGKYAA